MSKAAELRRRLDALIIAINGTLTVKLATLTANERAIYDEWRERCRHYHEQHPDADAYERLLNNDGPPPALPRSIQTVLFGPTPVIAVDMNDRDAADAYAKFANGG